MNILAMKKMVFVILLKWKEVINIFSYQMIGLADQNNRTYISKYGTYSKKNGFALSELSISMTKEELLDNLFHEDCWSLKKEEKPKPKKMTKEEIEKALGYKIEIDNGNDEAKSSKDTKSISKNAQKTQKNVFADDIFDFLFW